jgi:mannose-6-phosphate isomerase-like protein (cupin superfamily)
MAMLAQARAGVWPRITNASAYGSDRGTLLWADPRQFAQEIDMKDDQLSFRPGFRLSVGNARSQAAVMVLPTGGNEGGPENFHRGADQWLLVIEGTGTAVINGRKTSLKPGKLVLIEAGDRHEIRNTGRSLLKTVSVYAPPAYRDEQTELPAGRGQ